MRARRCLPPRHESGLREPELSVEQRPHALVLPDQDHGDGTHHRRGEHGERLPGCARTPRQVDPEPREDARIGERVTELVQVDARQGVGLPVARDLAVHLVEEVVRHQQARAPERGGRRGQGEQDAAGDRQREAQPRHLVGGDPGVEHQPGDADRDLAAQAVPGAAVMGQLFAVADGSQGAEIGYLGCGHRVAHGDEGRCDAPAHDPEGGGVTARPPDRQEINPA